MPRDFCHFLFRDKKISTSFDIEKTYSKFSKMDILCFEKFEMSIKADYYLLFMYNSMNSMGVGLKNS